MKILGTLREVISSRDNSKFYYVYPIYEEGKNGQLRDIDRYNEFPNKGTIFVLNPPENIEKWLKKIVIVDTDIEENFNYAIKKEDPNAAKYAILSKDGIRPPTATEIIEVITLNSSTNIEEIINNDTNRYIEMPMLPLSSRILLSIGDYVYGCFEYAEGQRSLDGEKQQIQLITKERTNNLPKYSIKKYKKSDIFHHIKDADIFVPMDAYGTIEPEHKQFIYNLDVLSTVETVETLDFIDDKILFNMLHKILNDSKKYELTNKNLREIKEVISDTNEIDFLKEREARLAKLLEKTEQLKDFKLILLRDFFQTEEGLKYKKEFLIDNQHLFREIVHQVEGYDKIDAEINEKKNEKITLENYIKTLNKKIDTLKEDVEKEKMEELQQKLSVRETEIEKLDNIINDKNRILEEISERLCIVEDFEKAKQKREDLKKDIETFNRQKTEVADELNDLMTKYNDFERRVTKEAIYKRNSDFSNSILNLLSSENINGINDKELKKNLFKYDDIQSQIIEDIDLDNIIKRFEINFEKANRKVDRSDIINYLICIAQRFITVFAGEPGAGKTSLCTLIAKCLGLYDERYLQISVERGWTSFKDLVGYYNPLTKLIEKSSTGLFDALEKIDYERKNNINVPYLFLLDEANLSSIEHYWSKFLMHCDDIDFNKNTLNISENYEFALTESVRFLATINFDHTTEMLSDRFLDRAWIIMIEPPDLSNIMDYEVEEITNIDSIISYNTLSKYFMPKKDEVLNQSIINAFSSFNDVLINNNIYISARSVMAIKNYCIVAQNYMDTVFEPLDYSISQKILPLINGYGDKYEEMLKALVDVSDKYELRISSKILKKILERGITEHGYYQFFSNH